MMRQGPLSLAAALLVLGAQFAVAAHEPVHAEESVTACWDPTSHFCASREEDHPSSCVLCQAGSVSLTVEIPASSGAVSLSASLPGREQVGLLECLLAPASAPRAPPVG